MKGIRKRSPDETARERAIDFTGMEGWARNHGSYKMLAKEAWLV